MGNRSDVTFICVSPYANGGVKMKSLIVFPQDCKQPYSGTHWLRNCGECIVGSSSYKDHRAGHDLLQFWRCPEWHSYTTDDQSHRLGMARLCGIPVGRSNIVAHPLVLLPASRNKR